MPLEFLDNTTMVTLQTLGPVEESQDPHYFVFADMPRYVSGKRQLDTIA